MPDPDELVATLRAAGCVFAEDEAALLRTAARDEAELVALVAARVAGTPLEQVVGFVEFCGLRLVVEPGVFVPRQRSRLLVEQAVRGAPPGAGVLDLCCGVGALGAAISARLGSGTRLHAADLDPVAVRCARRNLSDLRHARVYSGDLFGPLPAALRGHVDVLVANAPYVPSAEIAFLPPEARVHEPHHTLDGGTDGLAIHRRIAAAAPDWLAPGGRLVIETARAQAVLAEQFFAAAGLATEIVEDESIGATVVSGRRTGGSVGDPYP